MMNLRFPLTALHYHALAAFSARSTPLATSAPIVSFTFDDFPHSAAAVGGAILKRFAACGTYYTAVGLMNTSNRLGEQFGPDDLHQLLGDGHELANHTLNHISCASVSSLEFRKDVQNGRAAIQAVTGVSDSGNFAYPFGTVTLRAHKALSTAVTSCRTTFPGLNGPLIATRFLRANSLYGDRDRAAEAQRLILEAEARKSWLIFYSHDVRPLPSPFGCTPDLLELVVEFALRQGCRVLTVQKALALVEKPMVSIPHGTDIRNSPEDHGVSNPALAPPLARP